MESLKLNSAWDCEQVLIEQKLKKLVKNTHYEIVQSNGQRIYRPISMAGMPFVQKGAEIFVGNLPHDLFEDELIPLFSRVGQIYNLRLMLDFFGRNRGFVFISYFNVQHAHCAVATFNGFRIRKKTRMAVSISVDNRRLFFGNIPRDRTQEEIEEALREYAKGIVKVILYQEPYDSGVNRGFVFVEFASHRDAAIARKSLAPGNLELWGKTIYVDWAEPLPIVNPKVLEQVTKLYLNNLPSEVNSNQLRTILTAHLRNPQEILKVYKTGNFAFVHFSLRKHAEEAFQRLQDFHIRGCKVSVEWARPIEYSKKFRRQMVSEDYCRSVPHSLIRKHLSPSLSPNRKDSEGSQFAPNSNGSQIIPNHEGSTILNNNNSILSTPAVYQNDEVHAAMRYCEDWVNINQLCNELANFDIF